MYWELFLVIAVEELPNRNCFGLGAFGPRPEKDYIPSRLIPLGPKLLWSLIRARHGGVEKRGGWKTSRVTPLPKRGSGPPPLARYIFHPSQVSVLCFSCSKIHDRADQMLCWRSPKICGRARSLVRSPPAIRFAPPHVMAQTKINTGR